MTLKTFTESKMAPWLVVAAIASLAAGQVSYIETKASGAQVERLSATIDVNGNRITVLETKVIGYEERFDKLDQKLDRMDYKLDDLREQIRKK